MIDPEARARAARKQRRLAHKYLLGFACATWMLNEESGGDAPHVPPSIEHLHGSQRRKTLARNEARRISRAELYDFDAPATTQAVRLGTRLRSRAPASAALSHDRLTVVESSGIEPPAPCGFVSWGYGIANTCEAPILACHWETIRHGHWIVFWTANKTTPEIIRDDDPNPTSFTLRNLNFSGPLIYDISLLLCRDPSLTQQAPDALTGSVKTLVYTLLGTWETLATADEGFQRRHEPSRADVLADLGNGLRPRTVTCVSAAEGPR